MYVARSRLVLRKQLVRSMSTRTPVVGGNWKLNAGAGNSRESALKLMEDLKLSINKPKCEIFVAPPAIYLYAVRKAANPGMMVCAQNAFYESKGAFTGETSAEMCKEIGIDGVILGHSERRDIFGEDDAVIGKKVAHCQSLDLTVVACCGEHKEDRENGKTMDVLKPQLKAIADNVGDWSKVIIAYEPVWAIGTGLVATPTQAQDTCAEVREWLAANVSANVADMVRIQYGGSVNDENCDELAAKPDIDGFLVGGASLKADAFGRIVKAF